MTLDELRALATGERDGYRVWEGDLGKMAITLEDAEMLYALVRVTKPARVVELGTGMGVSARFIVEALAENANGSMLLTCEPDLSLWPAAERLLLHTNAAITAINDFSPYDPLLALVFIDSGWQHRDRDIEEWLSNGYRGIVVVHDANRGYPGLAAGTGVFLPGTDGLWIGRAAA